ncbi:hypothetical protein U14_00044 [Candidatus Moduliflexus flocculans]|uniref:PIN domain-containing protein n=1 Tax=Candidatus Moduliflexus flocculans TaxID=1499966 RepID=A0A0S6VUF3_9BACT|nr:hypothetical protein U14_00044 [Candidatus Moduliflexus flocculans]
MRQQKKQLYLDVCTLCRPFDDQRAMRVRLETDAYYLILQAVKNARYEMIISAVHFEEIQAITDIQERYEVLSILNQYGTKSLFDALLVKQRAEELYHKGLGIADAAHIAFAEAISDVFISCDDKLLKKCRKHHITIPTLNPVAFAMQEDLR